MKQKLLLVVALCIFVVSANAQSFGIKAGASFANQVFKSSSTSVKADGIVGLHVGIVAELPIVGNLYMSNGILYAQKGSSTELLGATYTDVYDYLSVPINLIYKIGLGPVSIFPQAGIYADCALSGRSKMKSDSGSSKTKMEFDDSFSRFDCGVNIGAGVEVSIIQVSVNYALGLADISNIDDASVKNGVFQLSAAVLF